MRWTRRGRLRAAAVAIGSGLALGAVGVLIQPVTYEATTALFVTTQRGAAQDDPRRDVGEVPFAPTDAEVWAGVATTPYVLAPLARELGPGLSTRALAGRIVAEADGAVVRIAVRDPDPSDAARIADTVAQRLVEAAAPTSNSSSGGRLVVVEAARTPGASSAPDLRPLLLAGLGGLAVGAVPLLVGRRPPRAGDGLSGPSMLPAA